MHLGQSGVQPTPVPLQSCPGVKTPTPSVSSVSQSPGQYLCNLFLLWGEGVPHAGAAGSLRYSEFKGSFQEAQCPGQGPLTAFSCLDLWPRSKVFSEGVPNKPAQGPEL